MELSNQNYRILLVDDDFVFYNLLKSDLEHFCILSHLNSFNPLEGIDLKKFDTILVDLNIGDLQSGEDLIVFFKTLDLKVPVIVMSADENQNTKLRLLKLGIDDYLWKSMHKEEIQVRIENAIQRRKSNQPASLGNLTLTRNLDLTLNGIQMESSKIEYKFLDRVLSQFPNPASLADLVQYVWNQEHVNKGTINTLVWSLNKKLSDWEYRISFQQDVGIQVLKK